MAGIFIQFDAQFYRTDSYLLWGQMIFYSENHQASQVS